MSESQNPYQSPRNAGQPTNTDHPFAPCPKCKGRQIEKTRFTWWGGALGPAILTHVVCRTCGAQYNGKTGLPNTNAIIVYLLISIVFGIVLAIALIFMLKA